MSTAARWISPWLLLALAATSLTASAGGSTEPAAQAAARHEVAPGLVHHVLSRGTVTEAWRYRVAVGRFGAANQPEADALLARLRAAGEDPGVRYDEGRYVVSVGSFVTRQEALRKAAQLEDGGFPPPLMVEAFGPDLTSPDGPWQIQVLEVDPARVRIEVALGQDQTVGLETTRSLAVRRGALAAVNGGFFRMAGLTRGDPTGLSILDGEALSETDRSRGAVGFVDAAGGQAPIFGRPSFSGRVVGSDGRSLPLAGVNRDRGVDEAVLFTPVFHRTTLTSPGGIEIVVRDGRVRAIRAGAGSSPIPPDGFVLSLGPEAVPPSDLRVGDRLEPELRLVDPLADDPRAWDRVRFALSAGPLILWRGDPRRDWGDEAISEVFGLARHPRTAIGVRPDGTLLLVTVDGREPRRSVGMSLPELTELVRELGAVDALNLDGGGSTTMVVGERVANRPSDRGAERWNSDAILLFPRRPQPSDRP